jgi:uncharacterized membrane protein
MSMRLFASVAVSATVFALAAATSVSAQAPADQPAAQPAPTAEIKTAETKVADKKKDGVVCRRETPTGSMFPVKVCTTPEQRKADGASARKAQETMQSASPVIPN